MRLRELFEEPRAAVMAFGRMNPPTIGHKKLVEKMKSLPGDPYIFLSQSQKPKTDPLAFQDKLKYAKSFFPDVNIGHPEVKTIIQALQKIEQLGYKNLIYVAGSDRVQSFEELLNKYNGKDYNFNTIQVVSAGERDPDADGAEGMSASKMRAAAAEGDLESFTQGVPNPEMADKMFAAVRAGMDIKDKEGIASESNAPWNPEGTFHVDTKKEDMIDVKVVDYHYDSYAEDIIIKLENAETGEPVKITDVTSGRADIENWVREQLEGDRDYSSVFDDVNEASYEGNLGLIELFKFFSKAEKKDPKLVAKVKRLIKQGEDKLVWKIVQDYTDTKLVGKEFEGSIAEAIIERACKMKRKRRG